MAVEICIFIPMETYNKLSHINNTTTDKVDSVALILAGQKTINTMLSKLLSISEGKPPEEVCEFYSQHEISSAQYYSRINRSAKTAKKRRY